MASPSGVFTWRTPATVRLLIAGTTSGKSEPVFERTREEARRVFRILDLGFAHDLGDDCQVGAAEVERQEWIDVILLVYVSSRSDGARATTLTSTPASDRAEPVALSRDTFLHFSWLLSLGGGCQAKSVQAQACRSRSVRT